MFFYFKSRLCVDSYSASGRPCNAKSGAFNLLFGEGKIVGQQIRTKCLLFPSTLRLSARLRRQDTRRALSRFNCMISFCQTMASVSMFNVTPLQTRFTILPRVAKAPFSAACRYSGRSESSTFHGN
jgi:hypothetical protein